MNPIGLYVSAAKTALQSCDGDGNNEQRLSDLNWQLPHLRQLLSCVVCCRLLSDPYAPRNGQCIHNVCRLCVRGRKLLRPICHNCKDCQDFKTYDENRKMRCLLLCYKSLSEHLMASPIFGVLSKQKSSRLPYATNGTPSIPRTNMSAQEIVVEGASFEDVLNSFSAELPHLIPTSNNFLSPPQTTLLSHTSISPNSVTLSKITTSNICNQTVTKVSSPPLKSISSLSATCSQPLKPEPSSPLISMFINSNCAQLPSSQLQPHLQSLSIKHIKNIGDVSHDLQVSSASNCNTTTSAPTFAYVRPCTSTMVLPINCSTTVTTAPLTIASAKLQSLNRQITHSRYPAASTSSQSLKLSTTSTNTTSTTATVTSQQTRNPPPIKTVSNGSAMYSVLYTGIGNKITIKRKTDGDDDIVQKKTFSNPDVSSTVLRQLPKTNPKRRGCRCGNATPTPGKLTCCGQRCPCYVDSKSCVGCKCRGCRNPHRPDGGKVRPVIPELACYEIQIADENCNCPNELPLTSTTTTTLPILSTFDISNNIDNNSTEQRLQHHPRQLEEYPNIQVNTCNLNSTSSTTTANSSSFVPSINLKQVASVAPISKQSHGQLLHNITESHNRLETARQIQQPSNMLHLENLQRESVLIQNAEGKYQVVNVFTASTQNQNSTAAQIPTLQRIHAISQQQSASGSCSNGSRSTNISPVNSGFMLPNVNSISPACCTTSTLSTSTYTPQLIMKHQSQNQHQHQQQIHVQRVINTTVSTPSSVSLNLQQQVKHNNIVAMHPISNHTVPKSGQRLISPINVPSSTITFPPIMVTSSPSTFVSDMFSNSSEELIKSKEQHNVISTFSNNTTLSLSDVQSGSSVVRSHTSNTDDGGTDGSANGTSYICNG